MLIEDVFPIKLQRLMDGYGLLTVYVRDGNIFASSGANSNNLDVKIDRWLAPSVRIYRSFHYSVAKTKRICEYVERDVYYKKMSYPKVVRDNIVSSMMLGYNPACSLFTKRLFWEFLHLYRRNLFVDKNDFLAKLNIEVFSIFKEFVLIGSSGIDICEYIDWCDYNTQLAVSPDDSIISNNYEIK